MAQIYTDLYFDLLEGADPEGLLKDRVQQQVEIDNKRLYEILEVHQKAEPNQIKKAYQILARKNHPDKGGDKEKKISFKKFKMPMIFQVIQKKERFTISMDWKVLIKGGIQRVEVRDLYQYRIDIFDILFAKEKQGKLKKMNPLYQKIQISLEESYSGKQAQFGLSRQRACQTCQGWGGLDLITCEECEGKGKKEIVKNLGAMMFQKFQVECEICQESGKIYKPGTKCQNCNGTGIIQQKKQLSVTIQKGAYEGQEIALYGEGEEKVPTQNSIKQLNIMAGDLIVQLNVSDHQIFQRVGADLIISSKITLKEALCGFQRQITHLDGQKFAFQGNPLQITRQNQVMTIPSKGMPFFNDDMLNGNLFVRFFIEFPEKITSDLCQKLIQILPGNVQKVEGNFLNWQKDDEKYRNPNPEGGQLQEPEKEEEPRLQCAQQ